jgi:hypothetical protein
MRERASNRAKTASHPARHSARREGGRGFPLVLLAVTLTTITAAEGRMSFRSTRVRS